MKQKREKCRGQNSKADVGQFERGLEAESRHELTIADYAQIRDRQLAGTATENENELLMRELHHDAAYGTGFAEALRAYDSHQP